MEIIQKHLSNGQYLTQLIKKTMIFLHHTAGTTADSAWSWWNSTPARVGAAFIIDRDGKIWQCYDDAMWAYHINVPGDLDRLETESIGIEIVSAGILDKVGEEYFFYPAGRGNKLIHTHIPAEDVETLETEWRGEKYFHKYTKEQVKAVDELLRYLIEKFDIKVQPSLDDIYDHNQEVIDHALPGIWAHCTVREKTDIYPSKDLKAVLKAIADEYGIKAETKPKVNKPKP
jgi:N-acetyl-anhydromuramyl-L-alanine amidase AmpD